MGSFRMSEWYTEKEEGEMRWRVGEYPEGWTQNTREISSGAIRIFVLSHRSKRRENGRNEEMNSQIALVSRWCACQIGRDSARIRDIANSLIFVFQVISHEWYYYRYSTYSLDFHSEKETVRAEIKTVRENTSHECFPWLEDNGCYFDDRMMPFLERVGARMLRGIQKVHVLV